MKRSFENIIADLKKATATDYIGLWWLVRIVSDNLENKDEDLQALTLTLLRMMLSHGFVVGELSNGGKTLIPWPDQQPDNVAGRIKAEWDALGREPNIGDIAWLDYRSAV
jgi:hypothetical protein